MLLLNVQDTQMEYDKTNRLIKYNGQTVKYDADGNMTYGPLNGEMTTFVYDYRNRLVQVGDTIYQYDAENYCIGMTKNVGSDDEVQITYVVDSGSGELSQILKSVETDKTGNSKVLYFFYGANHLVAQEEYTKETEQKAVTGTYLLYHFNNVGSTTAITDENGNVKYQYQYSPYGELIAGTYGQVAFLYNGQFGVASDDNGLYYMRARYYNIDIKRFINQDVVTGSIERSSSLNRYAYVEGNPVSYLDPFGLERNVANENGEVWYKLKCGFLYQASSGKLKIKGNIAFLSRYVCTLAASEIVSTGLIKGMEIVEVAAEIYSHVWVAEQLYPAKYFEDVPLLGLLYEAYDHAHEIDLEDGGEKVPGLKETFMTIWYGTSGILPF